MCGIIGIVGRQDVAPRIIESLRRLEYRGYDSAGIAVLEAGQLVSRRAPGKLRNLEALLIEDSVRATTGIGHTRWATHGVPNQANAHPHIVGNVAVVHNGIIENFAELKAELQAKGREFASDTDTEVVAHLLDAELKAGLAPLAAFKATLDRLRGAYALAILVTGEQPVMLGARSGPPLVVGYGDQEMFIGSDALAVGPFTQRIAYLEDGDYCLVDQQSAQIFDAAGLPAQRPIKTVAASAALVEKGNYRHFMEKEIHDQPEATSHTLSSYIDAVSGKAFTPEPGQFEGVGRIQIVACGTASYAGLISRYIFERLAGLPVEVEVASEFRYREPPMSPDTLAVAVSQSGETADTLAALRWCKAEGLKTAAVVNVHESTMAREADILWPTNAGPEIGVASTKAFTSQVAALTALAVACGVGRGRIEPREERRLTTLLLEAPRLMAQSIQVEDEIRKLAPELARARDVLYFGRGSMYALALEGALKLKEISYIHAEGYAAGELKHGPIALIDEYTPVIVLAPSDALFEKTMSNMSEVVARGGPIVLLTDQKGAAHAPKGAKVIIVPDCDPVIAPLVYSAPIQLLAYHVAVQKGADVDQPRNLAKSVTVE